MCIRDRYDFAEGSLYDYMDTKDRYPAEEMCIRDRTQSFLGRYGEMLQRG